MYAYAETGAEPGLDPGLGCAFALWWSDEVSQLPEVPPDGGLDEVWDAGVAVLAALYDLLYFSGEGLGEVDGVVLVLPVGHSMKFNRF